MQETLTEFTFRGTLAVLMILSAYSILPSKLGAYNLAASLGAFLGGLYGGGWAFRISTANIRKISSVSATFHVIVVFIATISLLSSFFLLHISPISRILMIGLYAFAVNSFIGSILEILWGSNSKNASILKFSTKKLIVTLSSAFTSLLIFTLYPNIYILIFVQPFINIAILLINSSSFMKLIYSEISSSRIRQSLLSRFEIVNSLKLAIVGLVTMLTYVIDNLLVAYKFDLSQLPPYSIAFAAIAFPTGIIGSTLQRIYSIRDTLKISLHLLIRLAAASLVLNLVASGLLFTILQIKSSAIISKSLMLSYLLYPYAYGRVVSILIGIQFGRQGNLRRSLSSALMQIFIVGIGVWSLGNWFGLPGIAISVSIASIISCFYMYLGLHRSISLSDDVRQQFR